MKDRSVSVDIDAMPGSLSIFSVSDYIGIQVLSPTALPLFRYNYVIGEIEYLGAENINISSDSLTYTVNIKKNLWWSDGVPIVAQDYLSGFLKVLKSKHSFHRLFLKDIENYYQYIQGNIKDDELGIQASGNHIIFKLIRPNIFFCEILSSVVFSPHRSMSLNVTAGAYGLYHVDSNKITLSRNPFFESGLGNVEFIEYVKTPCRYSSIEMYKKNEIDITCNTMFPYEHLPEFKHKKNFHQEPSQICMILMKEKESHDFLAKANVFSAINSAIDRLKICKMFNFALTPMNNLFIESQIPILGEEKDDRLNIKYDKHFAKELFSTVLENHNLKEISLTVALSDYFPNKEILNLVADEIKPYGVNLEFVFDDFLYPSAQADLRLHLCYPLFLHDFACYFTKAYDPIFIKNVSAWKQYVLLLDCYQQSRTKKEAQSILCQLNDILVREAFIIPLFKMQSLYLQRPGVDHFNFSPGFVWLKEQERQISI